MIKTLSNILALLIFCVITQVSFAGNETDNYTSKPIKEESLDDKDWKKVRDKYRYSDEKIIKEKKEKENKAITPLPEVSAPSINFGYIGYGFVIILLALLLFLIFKKTDFVGDQRMKDTKVLTLEDVEENIHESDLERFLREALEAKDLRLAVRIYYLITLKELSIKGSIRWKKDKTNYQYIREMKSNQSFESFKDVTLRFERIWYGDFELSESVFDQTKNLFKNYIKQLNPAIKTG